MLKKAARALEKWGYYLLALLCAAVILLSALWTNRQRAAEAPGAQALADESQRLAQATARPEESALSRPVKGVILRGYSAGPVYFPAYGIWRAHLAVDFAAAPGEAVYALADGTAEACEEGVLLSHGEEWKSLYRGLQSIAVKPGQRVRAGECLGLAGAGVPLEGEGHVCVALLWRDHPAADWSERIDKNEN